MLHLYESLFRAGYGEHPERFLSKDELDDYRASLSYYNSQYLELLAMLNTEQSVLFKKLQDNRSDIIGLERDASFRCGLCVGLKLGSLSSLLLSSMQRAPAMPLFRKQSAAEKTSLAPHDSKARLLSGRDSQGFMAKPCTPHLITRKGYATSVRQQSCQRLCNAQRVQSFKLQTHNVRGRGGRPLVLSLGGLRGILSFEKESIPL